MSGPTPRFLHRRNYRKRRLADAARMLPVAGLVALLLPLFMIRDPGSGEAAYTSTVALYVFSVWVVLIGVAFLLSLGLSDAQTHVDDDPDEVSE